MMSKDLNLRSATGHTPCLTCCEKQRGCAWSLTKLQRACGLWRLSRSPQALALHVRLRPCALG